MEKVLGTALNEKAEAMNKVLGFPENQQKDALKVYEDRITRIQKAIAETKENLKLVQQGSIGQSVTTKIPLSDL